jgi:hypothetical protein
LISAGRTWQAALFAFRLTGGHNLRNIRPAQRRTGAGVCRLERCHRRTQTTLVLFLNKFLPVFVLPLGFAMLLALAGLLLKRRWLIWTALALLYAASMPFTGNRLLGRPARRALLRSASPAGRAAGCP